MSDARRTNLATKSRRRWDEHEGFGPQRGSRPTSEHDVVVKGLIGLGLEEPWSSWDWRMGRMYGEPPIPEPDTIDHFLRRRREERDAAALERKKETKARAAAAQTREEKTAAAATGEGDGDGEGDGEGEGAPRERRRTAALGSEKRGWLGDLGF